MPWFGFVVSYGLVAASVSGYYEWSKRGDKNKVNETAKTDKWFSKSSWS